MGKIKGYVTGWDFHLKGETFSTFTLKAETFPPLLKVDTWWDLTQSTGVKNFLDTSHGGVKNFLYTWWRSLKVETFPPLPYGALTPGGGG